MTPQGMTDQELANEFREAYIKRSGLLKEMASRKFKIVFGGETETLEVGQPFSIRNIDSITKTGRIVL